MPVWRPWGHLTWILNKVQINNDWTILGCLSPEERCTAALSMIKPSLNGAQFWLINDPPSHYYDLIQERLLHMSESCAH